MWAGRQTKTHPLAEAAAIADRICWRDARSRITILKGGTDSRGGRVRRDHRRRNYPVAAADDRIFDREGREVFGRQKVARRYCIEAMRDDAAMAAPLACPLCTMPFKGGRFGKLNTVRRRVGAMSHRTAGVIGRVAVVGPPNAWVGEAGTIAS
jgi:hypothetical protein